MTEVVSRQELIDYWMDPENKQLCLVGGIGSGKTTLCRMFKEANPNSFVYDVDSYDNMISVVSDFLSDPPELFRVTQGISPVMLWIPGAKYLLLSTNSNPYLSDDFKEVAMRGMSPDHFIFNYAPQLKYRA